MPSSRTSSASCSASPRWCATSSAGRRCSPRPSHRQRAARARRVERQRIRELDQEARQAGAADEEPVAEASPGADLKSLYRRLARRFHPDLARTEEEQVRHAALMARINALYRAGDRAGLEALADQALGSELPEPTVSLEEEVRLLEERRARFESARDGLLLDVQALRTCATAELLRRWREAEEGGRDFFDDLRAELAARGEEALGEVRDAAGALEDAVRRANRRSLASRRPERPGPGLRPPGTSAAGPALARGIGVGPGHSRRLAREAERIGRARPELPGGREAGALRLRERAGSPSARRAADLRRPRAPVRAARVARRGGPDAGAGAGGRRGLVEFGIRRAGERLVQGGLRFRSRHVRDAVPLALRKHPLRVEFRRVLATLGERTGCPEMPGGDLRRPALPAPRPRRPARQRLSTVRPPRARATSCPGARTCSRS